jgi:hypothetical protein
MSIYVVRACRAKKGKAGDVQSLLKKAADGQSGIFVYQSMGDSHDFGVFAEFANEDAARKFAASSAQQDVTGKLASMVEDATAITVWKQV